MDIAQIPDLSQHHDALHALGLSGPNGLEQLLGIAQVASPELAAYLGVQVGALSNALNTAANAASSIPSSALSIITQATYSLGVAIDQIPRPTSAPSITAAAAAPPPNVNMVAQMPPIRDQQKRGTCVAHAALAVYEHFLNVQGAPHDMSEQFLYWDCKRNDGTPNSEGTWLAIAVPLLQRDGCCEEATWPYNPLVIVGNEGQGPPPSGAQLAALSFRTTGYKQLAPTSVVDIKNELANGRCVAFSIPVFNSWWGNQWVAYSGDIIMPLPNEIRVGGHAMCFVGYVDLPDVGLGGGRFIIRNSWGNSWGINSPNGAGYGTIPYAYIAKMGTEAYSLP